MDLKNRKRDVLSLEYLIDSLVNYWYLYGISAFLFLVLAFFINESKTPVYEIGAKVLINQGTNSVSRQTAQIMGTMDMFSGGKTLENEIEMIKSTPVVQEAVKDLDFNVAYFSSKGLKTEELYKSSPFVVILNIDHPQPTDIKFQIKIIDNSVYQLRIKAKEVQLYSFKNTTSTGEINEINLTQQCKFGESIVNENFDFKIMLNQQIDLNDIKRNKFYFVINNPDRYYRSFQYRLKVEPNDEKSSVANITMRTSIRSKDLDFLSSLLRVYKQQDVNKKNYSSVKTIEYIDDQLNVIGDSLKLAEQNLQVFKSTNQVIDLPQKSGLIYQQLQDLQRQKAASNVKYKYFVYLNDYFQNNREITDIIAPSSMGVDDQLFNNLIQELIQLNSEKNNLIENNQEKSPYLKKITVRIENLKNTIAENIDYLLKSSDIENKDIDAQISDLNQQINQLPGTQRRLLGYERKFNINDEIYTFLMQRRAEAQIAKSTFLSDADIIEPPSLESNVPVEPKKTFNYIFAFIVVMVVPFSFLRLKDILNNKIHDKEDISDEINIPFLGQVYQNNKNVDNVLLKFPKSHMAESFRMLRSSLNYFLLNKEKSVVLITSTFAQEGKTFIAVNLATSLAMIEKSTVLVGFDLRKPTLGDRLNLSEEKGLSSYLSNQLELDAIIQHTEVAHLDVIVSGPIPPNPSELISSPKTTLLIDELQKRYSFVILDSPPIGIISESYALLDKADLNIYIIRKEVTPKSECLDILNGLQQRNFKNLTLILNDVPLIRKSKYGYDYYDKL